MFAKLELKTKIFIIVVTMLTLNAGIRALLDPSPDIQQPAEEKVVKASPAGPNPIRLQILAERRIRARLRDPNSATFSDISVSGNIVCGYVNSRNGFGGMSGKQRFISGAVTALEEDMAAGEMDKAWRRLC